PIFERIKKFLRDIYNSFGDKDKVSPEIRKVFDEIFTKEKQYEQRKRTRKWMVKLVFWEQFL
ncbi:MAG: hypothetical protein LBN11_03715, partial [Tannerella sp.]|nr:hypothetical protein [Tannerella sp.]